MSEGILKRFWPHVPESADDPSIALLERVRLEFFGFAENINSLDADPRYKELALTALEESAMWVTKAIVMKWDVAPFPKGGLRPDDAEFLRKAAEKQGLDPQTSQVIDREAFAAHQRAHATVSDEELSKAVEEDEPETLEREVPVNWPRHDVSER